jgi:hypothetical protein
MTSANHAAVTFGFESELQRRDVSAQISTVQGARRGPGSALVADLPVG